MQCNNILTDDRAVSPVIGVILMVAITVILAAVVATFVLGLGDDVQDTSPSASFSFDLNSGADPSTVDDFGNELGVTPDAPAGDAALLTIRHSGGTTIEASELSIGGSSAYGAPQRLTAEEEFTYGDGSVVSAGSTVQVWVGTADTIEVIWESSDGNSAILADYRGPDA